MMLARAEIAQALDAAGWPGPRHLALWLDARLTLEEIPE